MTPYNYDLHSHSTASDGNLSPTELIQRAHQQGVTALALTDHDTTQGLDEAAQSAAQIQLQFIPGIEISTTWHNHSLHIVGLNINREDIRLQSGIRNIQHVRLERARKIAAKLAKKRIPDAFAAITKTAGSGMITRSHFADFLVKHKHVETQQEAFDRYLGYGKPAFVSTAWAELEEAIGWIVQAGGVAVLAHPMRYNLSANWMRRLLSQFKEAGGQAVEIVTGRSSIEEIALIKNYLIRYELHGSAGSDFHSSENQWVELGRLKAIPEGIRPVWELFSTRQ